MTEPLARGQQDRAEGPYPALHHVGRGVARELDIRLDDLAMLRPVLRLPDWRSNLRVGELAYDSVALSSLAISLLGDDRGETGVLENPVSLDAARIQSSFGSEKVFRLNGEAPSIWAPLSGFWRVADGWVRTHGNYSHHAERLARLLGLPADAERSAVEQVMLGWSRFDLEERAAASGALAIAVRDPSEWWEHPQYPVLRESPVVQFSRVGAASPRPWRAHGMLPLSGVRVLDLTRVIAGPVATRDLAVAGAEVLRIDSPRLPEAGWQHLDTGHEKRSALLDLDDPADFARFEALLADADVVVHGYRPNALTRYGLDAEALHRRFPGMVVAQLSAWGTHGPWGDRRGFDSLVQAATGIAVLESRDRGATPGALPVQALDHATGHFLAASIATALRAQHANGGSFDIRLSLARIANELLAAGPADGTADTTDTQEPLITQVPLASVAGEPTSVVTCAPPVLGFPGAPSDYPSPLHGWGSDQPRWNK
ncbi:CoA transferase [Microbacterium sp. J1-1]|uniref:CoA transferase n=1 Tax=Microbacterium sp. J1-1 TaxID=2992441 RepID=UPI002115A371|nr:CoA transferase [Microbacterium sp. J1-1]UUE19380.1 CoA transferase [Microbacterium sp. J1-1]